MMLVDEDIFMAVTIKTYQAIFTAGNEPDLTQVNELAAEGWELLHFNAFKPDSRAMVQWIYILQRSAGQTETDVLVGHISVTVSDNRFALAGHGLSNSDLVRFALSPEAGNVLPAPLVEGVYYFVVGARLNDFQVSLISGGSVVDITSTGVGTTNEIWRK
jgi:hypothetical protein